MVVYDLIVFLDGLAAVHDLFSSHFLFMPIKFACRREQAISSLGFVPVLNVFLFSSK